MKGLQILFFIIFVKTQKTDSEKNFQFQVKSFSENNKSKVQY